MGLFALFLVASAILIILHVLVIKPRKNEPINIVEDNATISDKRSIYGFYYFDIVIKFPISATSYADIAVGNLYNTGTVVDKESSNILKVKFNNIDVSKSVYDLYNINDNISVYHEREKYNNFILMPNKTTKIVLPYTDETERKHSENIGWSALCMLFMAGFFAYGGFFSSSGGSVVVG